MKRIKTILASGLVLGLTGLATLVVAAGSQHPAKAICRSIKGTAQYKLEGGDWMKLRVNQDLPQGCEIKTDKDSEVYLQVNGFTSTVKVTSGTDVKLDKMLAGAGMSSDTSTDLKLDGGNVLGSVRKLSANSDYSVSVPNGVAGIRGTDFSVTITVLAGGNLSITFTSVTGTIVCQVAAPPAGQNTATLTTGQSWTVTGTASGQTVSVETPVTLAPAVLNVIANDVRAAVNIVATAIQITTTTPAGSKTTTYVPPVDTSSTTGGGSSQTQ